MKNSFKIIATLIISMFLFSCTNDDDNNSLRDIEYKVIMKKSLSHEPFYLKGSYTNEFGEEVKVDTVTPWALTLKNVPASVKSTFQGKLFSIQTNEIVGVISMRVMNAKSGKVIYDNKKSLDLSKYTYGSLGYTSAEMTQETSFKFEY